MKGSMSCQNQPHSAQVQLVLGAVCHTKTCHSFQISDSGQCPKLRVHPAPNLHKSPAGCTHFSTCAPKGAPKKCTLFQSISVYYIGQSARKIRRVHPVLLQNKNLIQNGVNKRSGLYCGRLTYVPSKTVH